MQPSPARAAGAAGAAGAVLGGVDRATFVVALGQRLRDCGLPVSLTSMTALTEALVVSPPDRIRSLYWLCRLTLVARHHEIEIFDRVFEAAFADAVLAVDPAVRRSGPAPAPDRDDALAPFGAHAEGEESSDPLPWLTLPRVVAEADAAGGAGLPELLPSAVARIAEVPFDELDQAELVTLGRWLEREAHRWPTRRSRRLRVRPSGHRVALRETIAASRRTGWEPMELQHHHRVRRPLTVTLLCDLSQSMQSFSTAYLHLMRAFARTSHAEVFAFSTSLTRLTPALTHHSATVAVALASEQVVDRHGGTNLATCLGELLASRHGSTVRGGVLVIASDGWDSGDPAELAAVMARAERRARRIVWLNPRSAVPGYRPLVGSMAAALPYCEAFLPAHTLASLPDVFDAIAGPDGRRTSSRA